jgi:hypothetical protein
MGFAVSSLPGPPNTNPWKRQLSPVRMLLVFDLFRLFVDTCVAWGMAGYAAHEHHRVFAYLVRPTLIPTQIHLTSTRFKCALPICCFVFRHF